mmetsp:Transcript_7266/g.22839  ORF Transcript_7266/g.22839 Transcript_7266/m.22839 type:complete len:363 (-) Transcript_7266:508-1596(-)
MVVLGAELQPARHRRQPPPADGWRGARADDAVVPWLCRHRHAGGPEGLVLDVRLHRKGGRAHAPHLGAAGAQVDAGLQGDSPRADDERPRRRRRQVGRARGRPRRAAREPHRHDRLLHAQVRLRRGGGGGEQGRAAQGAQAVVVHLDVQHDALRRAGAHPEVRGGRGGAARLLRVAPLVLREAEAAFAGQADGRVVQARQPDAFRARRHLGRAQDRQPQEGGPRRRARAEGVCALRAGAKARGRRRRRRGGGGGRGGRRRVGVGARVRLPALDAAVEPHARARRAAARRVHGQGGGAADAARHLAAPAVGGRPRRLRGGARGVGGGARGARRGCGRQGAQGRRQGRPQEEGVRFGRRDGVGL